MKKNIGFILYIISILITILWIGLWYLIFNECKNCPTLLPLIPWWQDTYQLALILGLPIIAVILFVIGRKLRK
jgi:hypothetical protein